MTVYTKYERNFKYTIIFHRMYFLLLLLFDIWIIKRFILALTNLINLTTMPVYC